MVSDRPQVKYRVDREVKSRFERYVDAVDETGQGRYGRHLERAMRQYLNEDRMAAIESTLFDVAETVGAAKKKGKRTAIADGAIDVTNGKNPGDVRRRQDAVQFELLDMAEDGSLPSDGYGPYVRKRVVENIIEDVAGVHSQKTVKRYFRKIMKNGPFRQHPEQTGAWLVQT